MSRYRIATRQDGDKWVAMVVGKDGEPLLQSFAFADKLTAMESLADDLDFLKLEAKLEQGKIEALRLTKPRAKAGAE